MDGGLVGVVEWEELEKSKVANVCVSVVAVYRARVCRSRRYRRLHRAGYSHLATAWRGVTNGRRPGNLGYVKSATQNHFFCGGPDTFCVDDNNAPLLCERAPRVVSLLACILFTRRERRTGCPPIASHVSAACRACMALSKAKHTIFCYRSLTPCLPDPLRPSSLSSLRPTDGLTASDSP